MIKSEACRPPIFLIKILEAGGDTGETAIALVGGGCHVNRVGQRTGKRLEALAILTLFGKGVERLLGALDQVARCFFDRHVEAVIHNVGADSNELATLRQFINRATVFLGVDDRGGRSCKAAKIGRPADVLHRHIVFEMRLEGDGACELANADQRCCRFKDAGMQGFGKMFRLQEARDTVCCFIVDEYGAEQRLFRFDVGGRRAEGAVIIGCYDRAKVRLCGHGVLLARLGRLSGPFRS